MTVAATEAMSVNTAVDGSVLLLLAESSRISCRSSALRTRGLTAERWDCAAFWLALWVFAVASGGYDTVSQRLFSQAPKAALLRTGVGTVRDAGKCLKGVSRIRDWISTATHGVHGKIVTNAVLPPSVLGILGLLTMLRNPVIQLAKRQRVVGSLLETLV